MLKISFIIIAYNEERSIARCIDSILAQEDIGNNFEIIVVNDGSKDQTAQVVEEYVGKNSRVVLRSLVPNQGRGAARAMGVKMAQGDYLAFVDADIILPKNWLKICMEYADRYDAVGGIAIPDGDVNYIYQLFHLEPKNAKHVATVSGGNGLYKRRIFEKINFDFELRDGEDVAFNHQLVFNKFKTYSIRNLEVLHKETKTLLESLRWMYQSGIGATRQFKRFKRLRMPDLTYFGFLFVLSVSVYLSIFLSEYRIAMFCIVFYLIIVSLIFFKTRFYLKVGGIMRFVSAALVFTFFLLLYFFGRTLGWFVSGANKTAPR